MTIYVYLKHAGRMTNSVDPDPIFLMEQSDLGHTNANSN